MPQKGQRIDSGQTTEANANNLEDKLADSTESLKPSKAAELTSTQMKNFLATTIRRKVFKLRAEFLVEIRESQSAPWTIIETT